MTARGAIVRALAYGLLVWLAGRGALDAFGWIGGLLALFVLPFVVLWLVAPTPTPNAIETESQNAENALEPRDDHPLLREAREGYLAGRMGPYEYIQRANALYDLWAAQIDQERCSPDVDFRAAHFHLLGRWEFNDELELVPQTAERAAAAAFVVPPHMVGRSDAWQPFVRRRGVARFRIPDDPDKLQAEWHATAKAQWQHGTAPEAAERFVSKHVARVVPAGVPVRVSASFVKHTTGSHRRVLLVKVRAGGKRHGWATGLAFTYAEFVDVVRMKLLLGRLLDDVEDRTYSAALASTKDDD